MPRRVFAFLATLAVGAAFGQWQPVQRLTDDESISQTAYTARCVAAVGDVVHVVWADHRDGQGEPYYKRSVDGGENWGADTRLAMSDGHSVGPSVVAADSFVHVVWMKPGGRYPMVSYKRSTDRGGDWSNDTPLASAYGAAVLPCVALSDSLVHAAWYEFRSGEPTEVYYRRSSDRGGSWGAVALMSSAVAGAASSPSIAASGAYVHLVWVDDPRGLAELYYRRSTNNGTNWTDEHRLTGIPYGSYNPCVVAVGSFVHVVWEYSSIPCRRILHKLSTNNGETWGDEERLSDAECSSYNPSVALSGENVHVVWEAYSDGRYGIYYRHSPDRGQTWLPIERLTADAAWSGDASVAVDGASVHVAWTDRCDGNPEIYYRRNPTGNPGVVENQPAASRRQPTATVARGVLKYQPTANSSQPSAELLDIAGRKVMDLQPGDNDIRHIAPGIYFVRSAEGGERSVVRKIVIQK